MQSNGASCRYPRESGEGSRPLGSGYDVMLQAFNWASTHLEGRSWYQHLASKVQDIKQLGFSTVWLPPPCDSVSAEGYMPRKLESLDSRYGSAGELRSLIQAFHAVGITAVIDCVLNHRCADRQDAEGRWNVFSGEYSWDASAICSNNAEYGGTGGPKEGEDFTAAPNLDHRNQRVKQDIQRWLRWLKQEVGADGWRFDFVKGYSGTHVRDFIRASDPILAVGEFWDTCAYDEDGTLLPDQDEHRQRTIDWIDSTGGCAAAFDFTTKAVLQEAVSRKQYWRLKDSKGQPPGVIGWWPAHGITFVDNHDTGSTQQHWPFPTEHLAQGYAYILTHPGVPCVLIDHVIDAEGSDSDSFLVTTIRTLAALRRKLRISATCQVDIKEASDDLYAAVVDSKLAVKLGPGDWEPPFPDWNLEVSGQDFAVWARGGC